MAGLVNVRPYRWDHVEETSPGELAVTFWGSPHAGYCDVDRIDVREDGDRIVVTLYVGDDPGLAGPVRLVAAEQSAAVRLAAPVGARTVVDGAPS